MVTYYSDDVLLTASVFEAVLVARVLDDTSGLTSTPAGNATENRSLLTFSISD